MVQKSKIENEIKKIIKSLKKFDEMKKYDHKARAKMMETLVAIGKSAVPARRINEIVQCKHVITPDTALRLSKFFGLSERFWINLQARFDLEVEKERIKHELEKEVQAYSGL